MEKSCSEHDFTLKNRVLNTIFTTGDFRTNACSENRVLEHDFHYGRREGEHGFSGFSLFYALANLEL